MSDAEDTAAVPTTQEITTASVPNDDTAPLEDVSINEPPLEIGIPSTEPVKSTSNALSKHETVEIPGSINNHGKVPNEDKKQGKNSGKTEAKKSQPCPPPRSRCRARSRDMRQCKKHYREMIGQHEIRNDELEQRETDLRQRLEMLECSMPAVMVWNIWRMAQGAPVSHLREIVEKQLDPAGRPTCPTTPSQHWDCRIREVEAERKQALQRAEEARQVFAVKGDALKLQKQEIEEARRLQEERKLQIAKLEDEVKRLQDALKKAQGDENSCETGECGEIQCRQMWLQGVSSVSSIHSTDLECLARLQDLAEAELCMKRQIADLERRECAYMRTLQQADEMWSKMEDDNATNLGDLKEQLDAKIAANQQLADRIVELEDEIEKLRTQLNKALATLDEYESKTFADTGFGDSDISTKENVQQTQDEVKKIEVSEDEKREDTVVTEEKKLPKDHVAKTVDVEQLQMEEAVEYTPSEETEDKTLIEETEQDIEDPNYEEIQAKATISTTEESVQVKPESQEAETQSMIRKPDLEKETATEEPVPVEATTITEVVGGEEVSAAAPISSEVSTKHFVEQQQQQQQQQEITVPREALIAESKHMDELAPRADGSSPFKDKASSAHLSKVPKEDKDTGVAITEDGSTNHKEAFEMPAAAAAEPISRTASEKASEATIKTTSELVEVVDPETTPELPLKPVPKVSFQTASEPVVETPMKSPKPPEEASSHLVSEAESALLPIAEVKDTSEPVFEPVAQPAVDSLPIPSAKPTVETVERPVFEPVTQPAADAVPKPPLKPAVEAIEGTVLESIPEVMEPEQMKQPANTLAVPIQTLQSWQNVTACLQKRVSSCPQCSSMSGEIGQMLEEIRIYLGRDALDLEKIQCTTVQENVQKSVAVPTKKGSCICKPKTCPLDGTPAATPAQANVKVQTVVDGQSQTTGPIKIPSRDSRSPRSSKGSTKSKEEVKLMKIEEGTEPDPRTSRAKSIPEVKDETTVTVGDIASQTETVQKVPSVSKEKEKSCVCPTGVCPNKQAKALSEEFTPRKISTNTKKALGREYKSTADAILAPAIKVRPSQEWSCRPPVSGPKADDVTSESGSFACCECGKPVTPVPSRKTTSIPVASKSVLKSKAKFASESSEDDFLCCSCRAKDSSSIRSRYSSPDKSSGKFLEVSKLLHRVKPASGTVKTSCSREICCSCDKQETHVLTKTLTTDPEVPKTKARPETKDVCCLAKISRDKVLKTEARRRKDLTKSTTPSSGQMSSSSSTYKVSRTNDSSESNVCCSSIEQVTDMTKKKGKGKKCACDGQEGKGNKEKCVCGEDSEPTVQKQEKHIERSVSCSCPPNLFDKC